MVVKKDGRRERFDRQKVLNGLMRACEKRFTTYERIDEIPYMVVKKDGRRERFDRQKVLNGLMRACEKRPVPISKLEQIVNEAETFVIESA